MLSKERLVILSVPFQRINRVLLGPHIINLLREQADILIVSPFAHDSDFQEEFGGESIHFLHWSVPKKFKQPYGKLLGISEIMRMQGYWQRFRNKGMAYFLSVSRLITKPDGNDVTLPVTKQFLLRLLSIIGIWSKAWKIIDRLIGPSIFVVTQLERLIQDYKYVTLVQSASWGIQDRMLAWNGRKKKWRSVLVPYTTDQLYFCGYLMSDFDAICSQGQAERNFATSFHNLPQQRIFNLGSSWFRHIDLIKTNILEKKPVILSKMQRVIMYAGVSTKSFYRYAQYAIIDELLKAINNNILDNVRLVIRPVVADEIERSEFISRYGNYTNLQLQWPQSSCLGLSKKFSTEVRDMQVELTEYVEQLGEVNLVVMSALTSLSFDAAYLGVPSICVFVDKSKVMKFRHLELLLDSNKKFIGFEDCPVLHQLDELVPFIKELLNNPVKSKELASRVIKDWDYPEADFKSILSKVVNGSPC